MPTTTSQDPSRQQQQQKRIPNPRRLLILSPTSHSPTTIPPFLHALTGTPVQEPPSTTPLNENENATPSFAGYTTHPPLQIRNRYYVAEVPVWVDEIALEGASSSTSASAPGSGSGTGIGTETGTGAEPEKTATEPITTPALWKTEFSGPDAQVVRDAIGAVVLCLVNPVPGSSSSASSAGTASQTQTQTQSETQIHPLKEFLRAIGDVRALIEEERGGMGDVPGLVVLVGQQGAAATGKKQSQGQDLRTGDLDADLGLDVDVDVEAEEPFSVPWWEDQLYEMGLIGMEVVSWDPKAGEETEERNQFGEYQGMRRIREVLETHDWAPSSLSDDEEENDKDDDDEIEKMLLGADADEDTGFGLEVNELEREMVGLRFAIERGGGSGRPEESEDEGDDELRVDAVEALLVRMAAIRDMSDELPEHERKRFAAKAVRDIMKEI